VGLKDCPT